MPTLLISHPACTRYDTGPYHPERSERLTMIERALAAEGFSRLECREAPLATPTLIACMHPRSYIDSLLEAVPRCNFYYLDSNTVLSLDSGEAVLRAVGAGGAVRNAFYAVRPPGHHAEPTTAVGFFCVFNNVAIGARHARLHHGFRRVAVVDLDVHHGNGTQAAFWNDADLILCLYPLVALLPRHGNRAENRLCRQYRQHPAGAR